MMELWRQTSPLWFEFCFESLLYLFLVFSSSRIAFSSVYFYFIYISLMVLMVHSLFLQNAVLNNCSFTSENSIYFTFYIHNQVDQELPQH